MSPRVRNRRDPDAFPFWELLKLPVSWPRAVGQIPIFFGQSTTGRPADPAERLTSRYLDVASAPLFPFGHGLSYARFEYRDLRVTPAVARPGDGITVEVDIANSGAREGRETAFLFIRDPVASVARPVLELRGAAGITLAPGEAGSLRFSLKPDDLAFSTGEGISRLEPGRFEILATERGPRIPPTSLDRAADELKPGDFQYDWRFVLPVRRGADAVAGSARSACYHWKRRHGLY